MSVDRINPWLGLSSYEESMVSGENARYKFCGRSKAINEIFYKIENNTITTLYGKSGIGKTSILQAGLFPKLKANGYFPIIIRLSTEDDEKSYAQTIVEHLYKSIGGQEDKELNESYSDSSSNTFLRNLLSEIGCSAEVYPIIVLDQFEELFYEDKSKLHTLLKQIYALVDDSYSADENTSDAYANCRIVLSLREDDLFHLEDCIDTLRLHEIKFNRHRLVELGDEDATEVILEPGNGIIDDESKEEIARTIIQRSTDEAGYVNTTILSLVCSRIFDSLQDNSCAITKQHVETVLNKSDNDVIVSFYSEIQSKHKEISTEQWSFIEDELITKEGRRKSVLESEFYDVIPEAKSSFLFEGKESILRFATFGTQKERHVEVIHDLLADSIRKSKDERKLRETKKRQHRKHVMLLSVILGALLLASTFIIMYLNMAKTNKGLLVTQSRFLASESVKCADESLSLRMLLYSVKNRKILNDSFDYSDIYSPFVELVSKGNHIFRNSVVDSKCMVGSDSVVVVESNGNISKINVSTDEKTYVKLNLSLSDWNIKTVLSETGKYLAICNKDSINLYNVSSGILVSTINSPSGYERIDLLPSQPVKFSSNDSFLMIGYRGKMDEMLKVYDVNKEKIVFSYETGLKKDTDVWDICASKNERYVSFESNDTLKVFDIENSRELFSIDIKHYPSTFSSDSKYLINVYENMMYVRSVETGSIINRHYIGNNIRDIICSPQGKYIVTRLYSDEINVYNFGNYELVNTISPTEHILDISISDDDQYIMLLPLGVKSTLVRKITDGSKVLGIKHRSLINKLEFTSDRKYVVSTSAHSHSLKIWNLETKSINTQTLHTTADDGVYAFSKSGKYVIVKTFDANSHKDKLCAYEAKSGKLVDSIFLDCISKVHVVVDDIIIIETGNDILYYWRVGENELKRDRGTIFAFNNLKNKLIISLHVKGNDSLKVIDLISLDSSIVRINKGLERCEFSSNDRYLIMYSYDSMKIFDLRTLSYIYNYDCGENELVNKAFFNTDGSVIIQTNNNILIDNIKSNKRLYLANNDMYSSFTVSDNNRFIALWYDKTVTVVDFKGNEVDKVVLDNSIKDVKFSTDGHLIITDSRYDNNVHYYKNGKFKYEKFDDIYEDPHGRFLIMLKDSLFSFRGKGIEINNLRNNRKFDKFVFGEKTSLIISNLYSSVVFFYNTQDMTLDYYRHYDKADRITISPNSETMIVEPWAVSGEIDVYPIVTIKEIVEMLLRDPNNDWSLSEAEKIRYGII